ncbi:MAG: hypothetical protein JW966_10905 [Anaerolineae bacterium]|nr:hypothetical protein [Anaerolineae bacterium]
MSGQRFGRSLVFLIILVSITTLTACGHDDSPTATPRPSATTIPPVVTRIVTSVPTETPAPTPTLTVDLSTVTGRWVMYFELSISGSAFVQELHYNGAVDLLVEMDSSITGSGHFTSNLSDTACEARVLDTAPLVFSAHGRVLLDSTPFQAEIEIVPDDPLREENHALVCPDDYNSVRYRHQPILWTSLGAINWLRWTFLLESDQAFTVEADLAQATGGFVDGILRGEVLIYRY